MSPSTHSSPAGNKRAVGMALLGSSIAMATVAALAYAGVLPFDPAVRVWVAAGVGVAIRVGLGALGWLGRAAEAGH